MSPEMIDDSFAAFEDDGFGNAVAEIGVFGFKVDTTPALVDNVITDKDLIEPDRAMPVFLSDEFGSKVFVAQENVIAKVGFRLKESDFGLSVFNLLS